MGWTIAEKKGKYRIWSTNSDTWLTDWMSREEAITCYYQRSLYDFREKIIEQYLLFPHHWCRHDSGKIIYDDERNEAYSKWAEELLHKSGDEYYAFIDAKFDEIMKKLKIEEQNRWQHYPQETLILVSAG